MYREKKTGSIWHLTLDEFSMPVGTNTNNNFNRDAIKPL